MRLLALAAAAVLVLPLPAAAERVIAGLSQNRVAITANFDGSEIIIFGAISREAPVPDDSALDVIVTVSAPSRNEVVRRKDRVLGVWINTDSVAISEAPPFYAVASTGPLPEILSATEDLRHRISIASTIRAVGAATSVADPDSFVEALMRLRRHTGLYASLPDAVSLRENTLFEARIGLPANLVEGEYEARIFLVRDRKVIDRYVTTISVNKVGLGRWLYNLAHEWALIYGLLSLAIAISAGWLASAAFRLFRT